MLRSGGKVCLITGAGSGMGRLAARMFDRSEDDGDVSERQPAIMVMVATSLNDLTLEGSRLDLCISASCPSQLDNKADEC